MAITEDGDRSEIAFFDVETTVPTRTGMGYAILEFGSILVCPKKLEELRSFSTLVRPADLSRITSLSVRCNGITKDAVVTAPTFADIADAVYDLLHGRIWAGHNILRFDCVRIREAFAEIGKPAPEPKGTIDSLALLTQKFGRRAGDMKMATLATYFGLGQQTHRSLDDVRMNLEVLKYCATVLFLESSLPDIFTENSRVSPNAATRSRNSGKKSKEQDESMPSSSLDVQNRSKLSPTHNNLMEKDHPIMSLMTPNTGEVDLPQPLDMTALSVEIGKENPCADNMEEEKADSTSQLSSIAGGSVHTNNDFLEPDAISVPSLSAICVPFYRGTQKIQISYQNFPLQLQCAHLKVRFGISTKFVDHAGRPRLNFVVDAPPSLCKILDATDSLAQKLSVDSGSSSEWRPVVARKPGFFNSPTVRLHIPTAVDGEVTRWATEIYHKDGLAAQRLVFSRFDISELDSLFAPGNIVDVCFSLDTYDYQMNAGIRLVARKLMVHST